jgi:16S rRNA (cytidine1402-2'-O)-methyltransferase|tara:strand:+ start:5420 stop:6250 length:831 start_codon:yes stop_codon:yes gene_type:complete
MNFYIIPSPIGNLDDITFRSVQILKEVDLLIVENLKKAKIILKHYDIKPKNIVVYNDKSNEKDRKKIISLLKKISSGGIMSEAGTPLISDPGFKLITDLISLKIKIIPLPGATSVISSLVASGLPTNHFQFIGFFPKVKKDAESLCSSLLKFDGTTIIFESPKRIINTLNFLGQRLGDLAEVCVAKEITKIHESFFRGTPKKIEKFLLENKNLVKGEFVILVKVTNVEESFLLADRIYNQLSSKLSLKDISKVVSEITGINKNKIYKRFLSFSKNS